MPAMEDRYPPWGYQDLGMLLGAILPSLIGGAIVLRAGQLIAPSLLRSDAARAMIYQVLFYVLMLFSLYVLVSLRHGLPFWKGLSWSFQFRGAWAYLAGAPMLALGGSLFGGLMKAPEFPNPIQELISGRDSLIGVMLFVTFLGPLFEELMFRGFLFPLLQRSFGGWTAIVLTALPFALMHGPQYQWSWQWLAIVGFSGMVFGYARYRSGSTAASTLMHVGYNSTLFIVFLLQQGWI